MASNYGPDTATLLERIKESRTTGDLILKDLNIRIIPEIPENVTYFNCNGANVEELPALPEGLRHLYCGDCPSLSRLPPLPKRIETLNCYNTNIRELPDLPSRLAVLVCFNTKLERLPPLPVNLRILGCHTTKIQEIPPLPKKLRKLYCYETQITNLPELPETLLFLSCAGCENLEQLPTLPPTLEYLNCSETNIRVLPDLPDSLKELKCNRVDIIELPDTLPENLELLDIYRTYVSVLPELPDTLKKVDIRFTPIHTLPNLPTSLIELETNNTNLTIVSEDTLQGHDNIEDFYRNLREAESKSANRFSIANRSRQVTLPTNVFDPFMAMNVNTKEYLAENSENIVFLYGNSAHGFPRSELLKGVEDVSRIIYECKGKKDGTVFVNDVIFNTPYYRLMAPGAFAIPLKEFEKVIYSTNRVWRINDTSKVLKHVATRKILSMQNNPARSLNLYRVSLVGADHCQEGSSLRVYSLTPIKAAKGGKRRTMRQKKRTQHKRTRKTTSTKH